VDPSLAVYLDSQRRQPCPVMEANSTKPIVQETHNMSLEPIFYRVPIEVWCNILHHATTSSFFPYSEHSDGDTLGLSLSIIHNPYLFGVNQNYFERSLPYMNHRMYATHQRHITYLRQVCRLWNDVINRYVISRSQWMFTNNRDFHYPPRSMTTRQRPQLIIVDEEESNQSLSTDLVDSKLRDDIESTVALSSSRALAFSDHDLSEVRIAVVVGVRSDAIETLSKISSLRALSIDMRDMGFFQLLHTPSLMDTLTHLHIFYIMPFSLFQLGNRTLCLPNVRYLALQFDSFYFSTSFASEPLPTWQLKKLRCLSIAGRVTPRADETLGAFFD
jgi:hypothetical protein